MSSLFSIIQRLAFVRQIQNNYTEEFFMQALPLITMTLKIIAQYINILMRKHISDSLEKQKKYSRRLDHHYRFSEPKEGVKLVKINKNKLPPDFFFRKENPKRRIFELKPIIYERASQPLLPSQKAQSERVCNSRQRTSSFGCIEDEDLHSQYLRGKYTARNMERKKESKLDTYLIESARKLTTATRPDRQIVSKFSLLQEDKIGDNICAFTFSPQKANFPQLSMLMEQEQLTTESMTKQENNSNQIYFKKQSVSSFTCAKATTSQIPCDQSLNMTFFKAKSTYLPPIHRKVNS